MTSNEHDRALSEAFDAQAARFERAPVQSDPAALDCLVRFANFPPGSRILDAGCGPGLVSAALLAAGHQVVGVDLSREMIERAKARCAPFADHCEFHQISLFDPQIDDLAPFDGSISRYVLHHVVDPLTFVQRQVELVRPAGVVVLSDHLTDTDVDSARHHEALERARDRTHTANLTGGQLVDLCTRAGLILIRLVEESFTLDFDEWFDRGTPADSKEAVRSALLIGPAIRGFRPTRLDDSSIRIDCFRGILTGIKPPRASS